MSQSKLCRASFGLQCFWGAEAMFGSYPGVVTTRVGYAGGKSVSPTYRNIGDHIETVDIQFDPAKLSYKVNSKQNHHHDNIVCFQELLEIFFKFHDPTVKYKRQYISAILYHNEEQKATIDQVVANISSKYSKAIVTEVIAFTTFTEAEDYHQKYFLRKHDQIVREMSFNNRSIIDSPIACKLNSFCAGFGTIEQLQNTQMKLSQSNMEILKNNILQGANLTECGI